MTYAPPFGSAKDPVNMIGYAAMNITEGISQNIQWHQLDDELATGKVLLDVRNPGEVANGQFREFIHIPLDQLRERIGELMLQKNTLSSAIVDFVLILPNES